MVFPCKSKYLNVKTTIDGIRFDSKKEANYYALLKLLKLSGEVVNIEMQVKYELQPKFTDEAGNKHRAINYKADFVVTYKDGRVEVVDVKGMRTKEYLIKAKMFRFQHPGVVFKEV